jgi:hypothetical protein
MRFHPVQHNLKALDKISTIFRDRMVEMDILPVNPWKATRVQKWLDKMGARMKPGSRHYNVFRGQVDCSNFVNFKVKCQPRKQRVPGGLGSPRYRMIEASFMRIEIPWELADKVLTLGYLP